MNAATSREKRSSDKGQIENVIAFRKDDTEKIAAARSRQRLQISRKSQ